MPDNIRESLLEDALLDYYVAETQKTPIDSLADAMNYVQLQNAKYVLKSEAAVISGYDGRLAVKLYSYYKASSPEEDSSLSRALKKSLRISEDGNAPLCFIVNVSSGLTRSRQAVFRVPVIPDDAKKKGHEANLSVLISWAARLLQVSAENVKILPSQDLGTEVQLSAKISDLMTSMKKSLETTDGRFVGELHEFKSGFKGNLVDILGAQYVLRKYSDQIRKNQKVLENDKVRPATTPQELAEVFNSALELQKGPQNVYYVRLLRSILNMVIRASNDHFPGKWIHSAKEHNKEKTTEGLIHTLGYTLVCPSGYKALRVLLTDTFKKGDSFITAAISDKTYPDGTPVKVVRTAMLLLLPYLEVQSSRSMTDQISYNPLLVTNSQVLLYYKRHSRLVDMLDRAYLFLIESNKKGSKVTPRMFEQVRNRLLGESSNKTFINKAGETISSFNEVPKECLEFLSKKFQYKLPEKRVREPEPSSSIVEVPMETVEETNASSSQVTSEATSPIIEQSPDVPMDVPVLAEKQEQKIKVPAVKKRKLEISTPKEETSSKKGKEKEVPIPLEPKVKPKFSKQRQPTQQEIDELPTPSWVHTKDGQKSEHFDFIEKLAKTAKEYILCGSSEDSVKMCYDLSWTKAQSLNDSVRFFQSTSLIKCEGYGKIRLVKEGQTATGSQASQKGV
jgi:hypothetical protein